MNRERKHRVWIKENNQMVVHEQDFITLKVCSLGVLRLNPHHKDDLWEIQDKDRFVIMDFIGLQDKNKVDVYEGDIIRTPNGSWGVIVYKAPFFEVTVSEDQSSLYTREFISDSVVIGNIYANPELLKEK